MDNLKREVKKIRNLKQNQGKSEEELNSLAKESLEKNEITNSLTFCLPEEKEFATNLLNKYLLESSISSFSEKNTLRNLIDLEILLERVKKFINNEQSKANPTIPLQFLEQVTELTNQIIEIKEGLGLVSKKDGKNDASKVIDDLTERFHKWINKPENRSNYEFQCPKCAEIFLIRRRLDKEKDEVVDHPWFIDGGILFNKAIFEDLELGKISEDQAARFLNATLDYIKWIRQNYPLNQDKNEETENEE